MKIETADRVSVGRLAFVFDMPRTRLMPILSRAGIPVEADLATGEVFASRSALGDLLRFVTERSAGIR